MITVSHVSKRYPGGYEALRDVSVHVDAGELLFVTGHSGAGKSTLLKLVGGIERPTSGSVVINGKNITKMSSAVLPFLRRNFGYIFQDHKLLFDRSVYENVALPLIISGFPRREIPRRVRAALDKVGLRQREKARPVTLSGGEQQRLCIARAVVNRPAILLADEPTGNLDTAYAAEIVSMFQAFNQVGVTVLIATHDQNLIRGLGARSIRLDHGAMRDGTVQTAGTGAGGDQT